MPTFTQSSTTTYHPAVSPMPNTSVPDPHVATRRAKRFHAGTLATHASLFWFLLTLSLCQLPPRRPSPDEANRIAAVVGTPPVPLPRA
jgi:hypothetical protein